MITELIDKQDTFEIVRDQIANILALETASQQALAVTAGKDPAQWALRIFSERSSPWEQYLNNPNNTDAPIVNVWYDKSVFNATASSGIDKQDTIGTFNIDCYGVGVPSKVAAGGHTPADVAASDNAQRAMRLVRNMLMASENMYLQLRPLVTSRWPSGFSMFQPPSDATGAQRVVAGRLALDVRFSEFSPQYVPKTLETLSAQLKRAETGEIYLITEYNY